MEEILASIRSIIADDKDPPAVAAPKPSAPVGPQIVYSNDSPPAARFVAPAPEAPPAAPLAAAPVDIAPAAPKVVWEKPASTPAPAPVAPESPAPASVAPQIAAPAVIAPEDPAPVSLAPQVDAPAPAALQIAAPAAVAPEIEAVEAPVEEEPFVSPVTDAAVSASFNALSASIALQSAEMVERLTREMLRPMLKTWLDDNLPSLVERLVRAEIQRVARGGR